LIGHRDPKTMKITEFRLPANASAPHTLLLGNKVWFTAPKNTYSELDPATGKVRVFKLTLVAQGQMPMKASLQPPNKRKFALLTAAFLLLVLAGAGMAMGGNNFAIRSLAIVAGLAGVACVRRINVHTPPGSATEAPQRGDALERLIGRPIGIISLILIPIMAMASFFLFRDAVQGYHESWPLYLFFWTGIICTLCWAYVVSTLHGP
jgi:hypothetical protein